jgi:gamma-glutamyltranspeptidase/glutathione hydrolase
LLTLVLGASALAGCGGNDDDSAAAAAEAACQVGTAAGGIVVGSGVPGDPALPEPASGFKLGTSAVSSKKYMVVTANPHATQAGCQVLKAGGSAADAAVAVQMVLGLVEPQSSGLGGGAFILHYHAANNSLVSIDGRETAPAAATEDYLRYISAAEQTAPLPSARTSGRSIGTPGAVRALEVLHRDHGRKPWASNFDAGIKLATDGFAISGRLADAIAANRANLLRDPDAVAYFLNPDGSAKALGTRLTNPAYAATLSAIAGGGANALYSGPIADDIVAEIQRTQSGPAAPGPLTPGATTAADLSGYQARKREPVCIDYRNTVVCGMGPPSSGGIAVAQTLGILENFHLPAFGPTAVDGNGGKPSVMGVHLVSEAQRLAYADRNAWVADTDYVPLPGNGVASLIDKGYLRGRASLIRLDRSMGTATAGTIGTALPAGNSAQEGNGTTHLSIVDGDGNVVVMTTTVESSMGSFRFVRGFLLNNQLTDFSAAPSDAAGPIAQLDGADDRVLEERRQQPRRGADRHRLARRRGDHPVRRQDPGGPDRLGPGRATSHRGDELRLGQHRHHRPRRRAPGPERRKRRRQRPAGDRAAQPGPHRLGGGAVQRRLDDRAPPRQRRRHHARRRRRPAARGAGVGRRRALTAPATGAAGLGVRSGRLGRSGARAASTWRRLHIQP